MVSLQGGCIGKQCQEKREAWTIEEEHAVVNAHRVYGNKWAEIAKVLPRRYCQTTYILLG
uniref:Uncharacterized protein n=1 Tax=Aegilops tauschii subsp. strangulata TaxID=200361 RepID=A0A453N338_AEGTS